MPFKRADQVIYVPDHANGDVNHKDCELGVISSVRDGTVWCRMWYKGRPGELRTVSCAEPVSEDRLVLQEKPVLNRRQLEAFFTYLESEKPLTGWCKPCKRGMNWSAVPDAWWFSYTAGCWMHKH